MFLVAQQKLGQLENVERARGWLFAILRNAFLKSHRKRRPTPAGNLDLNIEAIPDNLPADEPIDRERLQSALDGLQPKHRIILVMFYYESCSYREIAERLDIPAYFLVRVAEGDFEERQTSVWSSLIANTSTASSVD